MTADRTNVIYAQVYNPISIVVDGVPCKSIVLKTSNGKFDYSYNPTPCRYEIVPSNEGEANIQIYRKSGKKEIKIGAKSFRVMRLPDPTAYIGNIRQGPIKKEQLLTMPGIIALGEEFHNNSEVQNFSIYIFRNNAPFATTNNKGARFEQSTMDVFKQTQPGDKILVGEIMAINALGILIRLRTIEYTVVE